MIRFGFKTDWTQYNLNWSLMKHVVNECERLGYDSIWLNDHFFYPSGRTDVPTYECWTMLTAIAAVTTHLRLATTVLCNSYRYPSVLAYMASTLDNLSGGRLDFGIGAGSFVADNTAYGLPFYDAPTRLRRLEEAVRLIKLLWTEDRANFQGKYYTLKEAVCSPKPVQKPHPPIWIGGRGEKITLRIVAKLAYGCNFINVPPEEYMRLLNVLEGHCQKVGRNFKEIERSWSGYVHIANDEKEARKKALTYKNSHWRAETRETPDDQYCRTFIVGTPEQCIPRIEQYAALGVTRFQLLFPEVHQGDLNGLRVFSEKVMPAFSDK